MWLNICGYVIKYLCKYESNVVQIWIQICANMSPDLCKYERESSSTRFVQMSIQNKIPKSLYWQGQLHHNQDISWKTAEIDFSAAKAATLALSPTELSSETKMWYIHISHMCIWVRPNYLVFVIPLEVGSLYSPQFCQWRRLSSDICNS